MAYPRAALADLMANVLVPFGVSTLIFAVLLWLRDPAGFEEEWPVAFVASGVIGIFALVGFLGHRSRIRLGVWRDFI